MLKLLKLTFVTALFVSVLAGMRFPAFAAANLGINPMRVEMNMGDRNASLSIMNNDPEAHVIQVQLYRWTQENGKDKLEPANDALLSPPIFTLEPNLMQQIRIALLHRMPADKETSYRVVATEVPSELTTATKLGVIVAMQLSVPVFIEPQVQERTPLAFQLSGIQGKSATITVANSGNVHARFASFQVMNGDTVLYKDHALRYLLPGQSLSLKVTLSRPISELARLHVSYVDDLNKTDLPVTVR